MIYRNVLRHILFQLDAEQAHNLTLEGLKRLHRVPFFPIPLNSNKPRTVMGLEFANPVGLAAGLDKNGDYIDALASLGFGFLEVGTVTPIPQVGNPKPRLFRLPEANAIINRMGFNNKGVDYLVERLKQAKFEGVIGVNIGKGVATPLEKAHEDYLIGLRKVYAYASYIVINVSSPNTKSLRDLQGQSQLEELLGHLKAERTKLIAQHNKYVPLVVKIAPDLSSEQLDDIAHVLLELEFDGVIATNTTISREGVTGLKHSEERGGLSGEPLRATAADMIRQLSKRLDNKIPIIAAGGIMSGQDARVRIENGASLVQIYTGLVYQGPELISEIVKAL